MNNNEKASIGLFRILAISLVIIFIMGIGVMASNAKFSSVKIILSNDYEMTVLTTKTKVSEILEENNITLEENEVVSPTLDEEITQNKTIRISNSDDVIEVAQEEKIITQEEILSSYGTITEKLITEQITIPYETITKEATGEVGTKQNRVVQEGKDGLKEVVYKVKYQGEEEIERTEISSTVISEPVNKIIEVRTYQVTSRSSSERKVAAVTAASTDEQLQIIWAVVRQEGGSSYESALAVASSAVNRIHSSRWSKNGKSMYAQLTAKNQYCYSIDNHWKKYLNGNVPSTVKQAVSDAMRGKTNHPYTSFRGYYVAGALNIGGNYYFGN